MKDLFAVALCIVIVALSACGQKQQSSNNTTTKTKTSTPKTEQAKANPIAAGKKVYTTYCLTCHGLKGDMGGSGAHDLTKSTLSFAETVQVLTEGRGLMTPHKFLGEKKINAVAKYIETFKVK